MRLSNLCRSSLKIFRRFKLGRFQIRPNSSVHIYSTVGGAVVIGGYIFVTSTLPFENPLKRSQINPIVHAMTEGNKSPRKTMNFIADAVEVVAPAVVSVQVVNNRRTNMNAVQANVGAGFIVTESGMLLTNAHVVNKNSQVTIVLANGECFNGNVVDVDYEVDLAAVKLEGKPGQTFPYAKLGSSANIRPGEFVAALGSPHLLSNTVTSGIVSSVHRSNEEIGQLGRWDHRKGMSYIQTDAPINGGSSGGPLVNLDGEVIGICMFKVLGASGLSFAIPSDIASNFLEGALKTEKLPREQWGRKRKTFYIGVKMLTLTPNLINQLNSSGLISSVEHGVFIVSVAPKSPMERANLKSQDVILSINGKDIQSAAEVYQIVRRGEKMLMKIQRGRESITTEVYPEPRAKL